MFVAKMSKNYKQFYLNFDYNQGYELGQSLLEKSPNNLEIKSWTLINGSRSDQKQKSLEEAQKFVAEKGENYSTLLALAYNQISQSEKKSFETIEKLLKISPTDEEAVFAKNSALLQERKYQESLDWLVKNESFVKNKSRFYTAQATSVYWVEKDKKDKGQVQKAFDLFAQAVKIDPNSIRANYLYGDCLIREKRDKEALTYLKKVSDLSDNPAMIRDYWSALKSQLDKDEDQESKELDLAVTQYLKKQNNSPEAVLNAWKEYKNLADGQNSAKARYLQKANALEKIITQKYPNTKYDEAIAAANIDKTYGKYFAKEDSGKFLEINNKPKSKRTPEEVKFLEQFEQKNQDYQAESAKLSRTFIKRPQHFNKRTLGRIAYDLLQTIAGKKETDEQEISNLVDVVSQNYVSDWGSVNLEIAEILLDITQANPNSLTAKDAGKYARLAVADFEQKVMSESKLKSLSVLSRVLIKEGKLEEAEKNMAFISAELKKSKPQNEASSSYLLKNNQIELYIARKEWDKAEATYIKNYSDNDTGRKVFEDFYKKRYGKTEGFNNYYATLQPKLKARAKERIVESRLKEPKEVVPFTLKTIEDKTISFADLKGKIVVINFWGTWCAPCVAEMNDLQELHDKYKDDKDVAVLTIDQEDELEEVRTFMSSRKLTIPVMMSNGYIESSKAPVEAYPTTFFIDKNGKISFIVVGGSENLVEEFSARIEILKNDKN